MDYTISYTGTKQEKYIASFQDAKNWIGESWNNFSNQVNNLIQEEGIRYFIKNYRIIFGMIGIKGIPARALCYYFAFKPSWISA